MPMPASAVPSLPLPMMTDGWSIVSSGALPSKRSISKIKTETCIYLCTQADLDLVFFRDVVEAEERGLESDIGDTTRAQVNKGAAEKLRAVSTLSSPVVYSLAPISYILLCAGQTNLGCFSVSTKDQIWVSRSQPRRRGCTYYTIVFPTAPHW